MRRLSFTLCWFLLILPLSAEERIPDRPERLEFPELQYEVPDRDQFRAVLDNGVALYAAEDRLLPLVAIQVFFKGGAYLEPQGMEGLASLTGTVWRTGGAGDLTAEEFDEELDFLAANLSTGIGGVTGSVSLNLLSKDLERGLQLLMDVLLRPRFQESRLETARTNLLSEMRQRNDSTAGIESREWNRLIYGDDYWINRHSTQTSVRSIDRDDLVRFQQRLIDPATMVVAAAGDFHREELIELLNETIGRLETGSEPIPPVPQPSHRSEPGVYLVDKPDVNQGRVSIGHLGAMRPLEDEFDIRVANDILGGSGFTSRITSRVRSDEGLAYTAGSAFGIGQEYPGTFRSLFQSRSEACARAAELTVELIRGMHAEGVTDEELRTSKNSQIETLPNNFQTMIQTVSLFARDELAGRPPDYWAAFRDNVRAVSVESAHQAFRRHINPERLVILVVGNIEEILGGDPDHPDSRFENLGALHRIPLRDPMTLEPME